MIVTFAPVRQTPEILAVTVPALLAAAPGRVVFADDNDDFRSNEVLHQSGAEVVDVPMPKVQKYEEHKWTNGLIERVAMIKNSILRKAREEKFDVMLVDSDLVLHPDTIRHLDSLRLPVACEVFWTAWREDGSWPAMPNAWDTHPFFIAKSRLLEIRAPGQYQFRALGACTLIRHTAVAGGANFDPLHSLRWGEDRWFALRCEAAGIPLVLDTTYPARHLYRGPGTPEPDLGPAWEKVVRNWGGTPAEGMIGMVPQSQSIQVPGS